MTEQVARVREASLQFTHIVKDISRLLVDLQEWYYLHEVGEIANTFSFLLRKLEQRVE